MKILNGKKIKKTLKNLVNIEKIETWLIFKLYFVPWQQPLQFNSTKKYLKKKPWAEMLANTLVDHTYQIHMYQIW